MNLRICILFSLLNTCLAQRWRLYGCCKCEYLTLMSCSVLTGRRFSLAQYITAIEAAVAEGITMAETAYDVLENNYSTDKKVQQMVKYILGDDAGLPPSVDKAKCESSCVPVRRLTLEFCVETNSFVRSRKAVR